MTRLLIPILAACLAVVPHTAAADAGHGIHFDIIDRFVAESVAKLDAPGAAVAVVKDGTIVYRKAYGRTGIAPDAPLAVPETMFGTGSIGKTFTSTLVLSLVEQGLIDLDAPVTRYLPEFRLSDDGATLTVTVRDLLTMRSGLGPSAQRLYHRDGAFDASSTDVTALLATVPLEGRTGIDWTYSNMDYMLLGQVVEAVTGMGFADAMRERIFGPLGMTATTYDGVKATEAGLVLHRSLFAHLTEVGTSDMPSSFAAAGLVFSTIDDLGRFAASQLPGTSTSVLTPATVAAAHEVIVPTGLDPGISFGFGWMVRSDQGEPYVFYEGGGSGMSAGIYLLPERRMAVVAMFNAAAYPGTWTIGRGITDIVRGREPAPIGPSIFSLLGKGAWAVVLLSIVLTGATAAITLRRRGQPRASWRRRLITGISVAMIVAAMGLLYLVTVVMPHSGGLLAELTALPFRSTWHGWPQEVVVASSALTASLAMSALFLISTQIRKKPHA